jgi:hypothetical protein
VLPQVLAGLGALSVFSAGCALWLERLQPVFILVAVSSLGYQGYLVWRRPARRRTTQMLIILWASIGVSVLVLLSWIALSVRYR